MDKNKDNNSETTREMKVRVFDLNGLVEYGEIDGSVDIKSEKEEVNLKNIKAFYMNSNNEFNLMIRETEVENGEQ